MEKYQPNEVQKNFYEGMKEIAKKQRVVTYELTVDKKRWEKHRKDVSTFLKKLKDAKKKTHNSSIKFDNSLDCKVA